MSERAGLGEALERIDQVMGGLNSLQRERVTSILDDYYFGPTRLRAQLPAMVGRWSRAGWHAPVCWQAWVESGGEAGCICSIAR